MASSWAASWGTSWGVSWGDTGVTPPVVVTPDFADGYKRRADKAATEFEDTRRQDQLALRNSIERAFDEALGLTPAATVEPLPKAERKELARTVQADLKLDGITASLRQIDRLLRDYEQALIAKREQEWEDAAIAILLLSN